MKIPVFYRPEQSSTEANSYSPSAGKPAQVVADWLEHLPDDIEIQSFEPVERKTLYAVHKQSYVDGVLDCKLDNGFGNRSRSVANTLPYTVGSMVAAAKHVLTAPQHRRLRVAVSPTSGFHHAAYNHGGGFCTFNGLMAAAAEVQSLGLAKRILILDFDNHMGDGTEDIIERKMMGIRHITSCISYRNRDEALDCAGMLLRDQVKKYDLILYQAGADIHIDDPLGGLLTTDEMIMRDHLVFSGAVMRNTPIVWSLAGGYNRDAKGTIEPVLKLHRNTMEQCIRTWEQS